LEVITNLKNKAPIDDDASRVTEFSVQGYFLKGSPYGYWVPENRRVMGDRPWFITYHVTDYYPYP